MLVAHAEEPHPPAGVEAAHQRRRLPGGDVGDTNVVIAEDDPPADDPELGHLMMLFVRQTHWGTPTARKLHEDLSPLFDDPDVGTTPEPTFTVTELSDEIGNALRAQGKAGVRPKLAMPPSATRLMPASCIGRKRSGMRIDSAWPTTASSVWPNICSAPGPSA